MIRQRIHYLQMAYLNILDSDINQPIVFGECCKKAIKQLGEIGIKVIKNHKTIMQWNRVSRVNEVFPHPNYYIEMGKSDQPALLETFPEVKVELNKWAKLNITNFNFENIGIIERNLKKITLNLKKILTVGFIWMRILRLN